jgi:hypothetical protein
MQSTSLVARDLYYDEPSREDFVHTEKSRDSFKLEYVSRLLAVSSVPASFLHYFVC